MIIGGTKSIGYELTKQLKQNNFITVIARHTKNPMIGVKYVECDITKKSQIDKLKFDTHFNIVFCCVGGCDIVSKTMNNNLSDNMMTLNYNGPMNMFLHLNNNNLKNPFTCVFFSSTAIYCTMKEYFTYAPSKCALYKLYEQINLENPDIAKIVVLPNVCTESFQHENKMKSQITKEIENNLKCLKPKYVAEQIIEQFYHRNVITVDVFTYFLQIKYEYEHYVDYIMFVIGVITTFSMKTFIRYKIRNASKCD